MSLIIKWIALALAMMFTAWIIPGISVAGWKAAAIAAVVIALVNVVIKPVLLLLTLPINVLTLGLSVLIINALLFMFVAHIVPGVTVDGFVSAFLGALVLSILSVGISWL